MHIYNISSLKELTSLNLPNITTIAIGTFSLVHIGHLRILNELMHNKASSALIVLESLNSIKRVSKTSFKFYLNKFVNNIIFVKMLSTDFHILANEFITILKKAFVDLKTIVHGEDWRFGFKRLGNASTIIRNGLISKQVLTKYDYQNNKISSSKLFNSLTKPKLFNLAIEQIITKPSLIGQVNKGKGNGAKLGFPTANLSFAKNQLQINPGIYFTKTYIIKYQRFYNSITNIGLNPTIQITNNLIKHETHILDFNKPIYNEIIEVFYYYLYGKETKYNSLDELKLFINKAILECKKFYGS